MKLRVLVALLEMVLIGVCTQYTTPYIHQIKSNQILYHCGSKSWPERCTTLSATHRNN